MLLVMGHKRAVYFLLSQYLITRLKILYEFAIKLVLHKSSLLRS